MKISGKPYKLINKIQHYEWGTMNDGAFIPNLLNIEPEKNVPYAELWIGTHEKAPSEITINKKNYKLNELFEKFPKEFLGEYIITKFGNKLPFLLKVLSASKALSIQTHPSVEQAYKLNAADPVNYPDRNHKPEIAVALDSLTSLAGFRPIIEIKELLNSRYEFRKYYGGKLVDEFLNEEENGKSEKLIGEFVNIVLKSADDTDFLKNIIDEVIINIKNNNNPTPHEKIVSEQFEEYGYDVGLLIILFMNIVILEKSQAIFTGPGIPHAYLKGNIVECMANSDNVVRAGLTPKFKDIKTLTEILNYEFTIPKILNEDKQKNVKFESPTEEFSLSSFNLKKNDSIEFVNKGRIKIFLVTEGEIEVRWSDKSESFIKGDSFLKPAIMDSFNILTNTSAEFFVVEVE